MANFYLLPSRAWELLLGVLAALYLFSGNENKIKLPSWIKETAALWAEDKIDNKTFVNAIQYLIKSKIIIIPHSSDHPKTPIDDIFPTWVKSTAGWWAKGFVTDKEFIDALQFLIVKGIIKL